MGWEGRDGMGWDGKGFDSIELDGMDSQSSDRFRNTLELTLIAS